MKKVITILLTIVIIFSFASVVYALGPITKEDYYARSTLSGDELAFYDERYDSFTDGNTERNSSFGLSDERAKAIVNYVYCDSPELYNYYGYYSDEETSQLQAQIDQKSAEILGLLDDDMTDYEKAQAIYFYLGKNIVYDDAAAAQINSGEDSKEAADSQTIVGGLINGKAVCSGISLSLEYLLYQIGVPCYMVQGKFNGVDHVWNIIQIDGEWYYADLTYDFQYIQNTDADTIAYFLKDDSLLDNHIINEDVNPPLPTCTSTKYMQQSAAASPVPLQQPTTLSVQVEEPVEKVQPEEPQSPIWYIIIGAIVISVITIAAARKKSR